MSTCRTFVERVSGYLDGVLEPAELHDFTEHRALCPGCHRYVGQMRRTVDLLGTLCDSDDRCDRGDCNDRGHHGDDPDR